MTALGMDTVTEKSGHQVTGMAVSVCTTPAAPSPLPIPYPTMGTVAEGIIDEPLRTKINGSKHATVGSCVKTCHGNEAGTLKEVVSLNTAGPCFLTLGAPTVLCELGMMGITGSLVQMNKAITVGVGGSASGAGGSAGGGGGGGGSGDAGGPAGPSGPSGGGGGGGSSNTGASPPNPGAPPGSDGAAAQGHPVDVVTGAVFVTVIDFLLASVFTVPWVRTYRTSAVHRDVGLGRGWTHSLAWSAKREGDRLVVTDPEGRAMPFAFPEEGVVLRAPFRRSLRREGEQLVLDLDDGVLRHLTAERGSGRYRLTQIRDRVGNVAEVTWEGDEFRGIVDPADRRVRCERHGNQRVFTLEAIDAEGQAHSRFLASYETDDRGDLVRVIEAGGAATVYAYDDEHYLVSETRPDGLRYCFRYASVFGEQRCVETWGELPDRDVVAELRGAVHPASPRGVFHTRFEYVARSSSRVVDAEGGVHLYEGNESGLVTRYTDALGGVMVLSYGDLAQLTSVTDPEGGTRRWTYDGFGRVRAFVDALGQTTTYQRDAEGMITEVRESDGAVWRMTYEKGLLVERVDPDEQKTTFAYDEVGRVVSVTGPTGVPETMVHDAHGNLVEITDVRGSTWRYTYDLFGTPVRVESPTGAVYRLEADARGDLVRLEGPEGQNMEYQFDGMRRPIAVRHPSGQMSEYRYLADVLVERTYPDGTRVRMGYDALLQPLWLENAAGERYHMVRDAAGNVVREHTFTGVLVESEYNRNGLVVGVTRNNATRLRLVRDIAGRIRERQHPNGDRDLFERNGRGQILRARNAQVEVTLERDVRGRVLRETQSLGGWRFQVEHEHDARGWAVGTRYSTGWGTRVQRGPGGVTDSLELLADQENRSELVEFRFDSIRREVARTFATNGSGVATERDAIGRPRLVRVLGGEGEVLRERQYEWAVQGPIARVVDSAVGERRYSLDVVGRPLAAQGLGVEERFAFAPQGTPISLDHGCDVGFGGRVVCANGVDYGWDALGRLVARRGADPAQSWTFDYGVDDTLSTATRGDGLVVKYLYDPFGRRVVESCDGRSTWFGWDGHRLVDERATDGAAVVRVFAGDGFTPLAEGDGRGNWRMVACDAAATPWYYLGNDGTTGEIDLTTWGAVARRRGEVGLLRQAGQRADPLTGLSWTRYRCYAPELGLFTTPDPIGLDGSIFDVGYSTNPTLYIDPLGLIIIQGSDDPVIVDSAQTYAAARGERVVHINDVLAPGSNVLAGERSIVYVGHGAPGMVEMGKGLIGSRMVSGATLGKTLNNAGFDGSQPGANVEIASCNGATRPLIGRSVAQGVADATLATTEGAQANHRLLANLGIGHSGAASTLSDGTEHVSDGTWVTGIQPRPF
ncbi:MAG: DUF4150 domain-containing protein [Polyangiaceae bacterium]|nr:DUF4150 domain-containing protein [Polyangiaceae bacterium]